MDFSANTLFDFCYAKNYQEKLDSLEKLAIRERWNYTNNTNRSNQKHPILENYIRHTFMRLSYEYREATSDEDASNIIYMDAEYACFNTGLYTPTYEAIYGLCRKSRMDSDAKEWFFLDFMQESHHLLQNLKILPKRPNYFKDMNDFVYNSDYVLRYNSAHILEQNIDRFPDVLRNSGTLLPAFEGAIKIAQKRVLANYKIAVPTFFKEKICMLLPIDLTMDGNADLALAIERNDVSRTYLARTCLTLDMAYNDARLIAKPDDEWLRP